MHAPRGNQLRLQQITLKRKAPRHPQLFLLKFGPPSVLEDGVHVGEEQSLQQIHVTAGCRYNVLQNPSSGIPECIALQLMLLYLTSRVQLPSGPDICAPLDHDFARKCAHLQERGLPDPVVGQHRHLPFEEHEVMLSFWRPPEV